MKLSGRRVIGWMLAVGLCLLTTGRSVAAPADGAAELKRTWQSAWIFAPAANAAGYSRITASQLVHGTDMPMSAPKAVVLYAHGCDGLSEISAATGRFLAQAGYLVAEPDSFARKYKTVSCELAQHLGGLDRAVLGQRQHEMGYAARRLRTVRRLRNLPLVIMGHSEGAITVATVKDLPASGRIIEGWTCHAGWPEYRGLAAPDGQLVLALVGQNDPWYRAPVLHGDCGAFMHGDAEQSIVFHPPNHLAHEHWLSSDIAVQETILGFIRRITR